MRRTGSREEEVRGVELVERLWGSRGERKGEERREGGQ